MSSSLTERAISIPAMNWFVYALENETGTRYVGYAGRYPELRLQEHDDGLNRWTGAHRPWRLVYSECHESKSAAIRRERYLKTGAGREELLCSASHATS